jgi:hypothetical protein
MAEECVIDDLVQNISEVFLECHEASLEKIFNHLLGSFLSCFGVSALDRVQPYSLMVIIRFTAEFFVRNSTGSFMHQPTPFSSLGQPLCCTEWSL